MIKVVFACNDGYFDGLYLSILSIVRRCNKPIDFYVLSADYAELNPKYVVLSKQHCDDLTKLVKKYNKQNNFKLIDCTKEAKRYLLSSVNVNRKHFSPYTNLRLLIHLYPEFTGKVIYLDTDTMACGDIYKLYNVDIEDNEIAVCHNWWGKNTIAKGTFNAGVILFNMPVIKETKLLDKAIKIFNTKKMAWADQTAIVESVSKLAYFPINEYRFNRQSEQVREGDIIKHFCNRPWGWPFWNNIKQWDIKNVHKHLKIHCFDEDYRIWEEWKKDNK